MTKTVTPILTCEAFSLTRTDIVTSSGLEITEFWLYDNKEGYNLAMRATSEYAAFQKAIEHYQEKTANLENQLKGVKQKVNSFLRQFNENYNAEGDYPDDAVEFASSYR